LLIVGDNTNNGQVINKHSPQRTQTLLVAPHSVGVITNKAGRTGIDATPAKMIVIKKATRPGSLNIFKI